eukprot:Rhum_TRINITY_DN15226_c0_g1::Rhum_TRINITY_DN15226_c0_g1_i3::g.145544::m.145544
MQGAGTAREARRNKQEAPALQGKRVEDKDAVASEQTSHIGREKKNTRAEQPVRPSFGGFMIGGKWSASSLSRSLLFSPCSVTTPPWSSKGLCGKDLEGTLHGGVHGHHATRVVELSAVVGSGEQSDKPPVGKKVVAVFDDLVCPHHKLQVQLLKCLDNDVCPEVEGDLLVGALPTLAALLGVGPQQVAHEPSIRHVGRACDLPQLLKAVQLRREPSVHAQDALPDNGRQRHGVERVVEPLPDLDARPTLTLVVEAVDTRDGRTLVVSTQQEEVVGVLHLVRHQREDHLQRACASVHVVPQEQVVRLGRRAAQLEPPQKILVLSVDVPEHAHRCREL